MAWRWLKVFAVLAGLGVLAGAGWFCCFRHDSRSWLDVEAELEVPWCVSGQERQVVFHLHNRSGRPMRILGLSGACGLNACLFPPEDYKSLHELPAGEFKLVCKSKIGGPGEFRAPLYLWVDDHGTREIVLSVHGTATGPLPDEKEAP
jgi:hypothetical protein